MNAIDLNKIAKGYWLGYCEIFPRLLKFDCPKIIINNRFRNLAGRNVGVDNTVELSGKYLKQFEGEILLITLPHELAHQIDYNLHGGYPENNRYHGPRWKAIMQAIGQEPNTYHTMDLK